MGTERGDTASDTASGSDNTGVAAPAVQPVPRHPNVIEWEHLIADHLVLLMALAGDEHKIARLRQLDGIERDVQRGRCRDGREDVVHIGPSNEARTNLKGPSRCPDIECQTLERERQRT